MIKLKLSCLLLFSCCLSYYTTQAQVSSEQNKHLSVNESQNNSNKDLWSLTFSDEFNNEGAFDSTRWTFSPRWHPAWAKFLTPLPSYATQSGGELILRMDNATIENDDAPYHSGGIQTSGKFNFRYGKVEVRAIFNKGKGSWPAIWLMPDNPIAYGDWPNSGEIDIMEHVNLESVIHQSIHNRAVTDAEGASSATKASTYNEDDYNIYAIVWDPSKIEFYVNDVLRYTYAKPADATSSTWPFDQPFYLILNQSGGAGWPGEIEDSHLPFEMKVDYVRVYQKKQL